MGRGLSKDPEKKTASWPTGGASEGLARLRPLRGARVRSASWGQILAIARRKTPFFREAVLGWGPVAEGDGAGSLQRPREKTASWPIGGASEGLARLRPVWGARVRSALLGQILAIARRKTPFFREAVLGWGPVAEGDGAGSLQRPREKTASWPIGGASEGLARLRPVWGARVRSASWARH